MASLNATLRVADAVGVGHVCLIGAGEYLDAMVPVDAGLLALTPAVADCRRPRVVCLPTAAGTEGQAVIDRWMQMGVEHFAGLMTDVEALPITNHATAIDEGMAAVVAGADLVYLSGGRPPHLLGSLRATPTWRAILDVLARGGVLAGCSAGAMIMGSWIVGWPAVTTRREGFALVPDAIVVPHFDERFGRMPRIAQMRRPPGSYLLGIDGMTGLLVGTDGWRVLGERRVVVDDGDGRRELRADDAAQGLTPRTRSGRRAD